MKKIVVTGALSYSGKIIAEKLISKNYKVKTITNSINKDNPFGDKLIVEPFNFDKPQLLEKSLQGYDVLINTYWVRFNHKKFNHQEAVNNSKLLFDAAQKSGVRKIIHTSITNPSRNTDLEYFKGKWELEEYLSNTGLEYVIVRPAVLFGKGDILINNISWMIKHLPMMGVFGKGDYKIQPIHVDDFADLMIDGINSTESNIINAIGPETFTYRELVEELMNIFGMHKLILNISPIICYYIGRYISYKKKDVTITKEEIKGLMDNLLYVDDVPRGHIKLTQWAKENKHILGEVYANELKRRK